METEPSDGMQLLVSQFTQLVKSLMQQAAEIDSPEQVRPLEQTLRVREIHHVAEKVSSAALRTRALQLQ